MFLQWNRSAKKTILSKALTVLILSTFLNSFIIPPYAVQAQILPTLPSVGSMVVTSPAYVPVLIKGIRPDPQNPLQFHFIVNTGNDEAEPIALREESARLIKYFLASLTVPETDLWVNLSPYEGNRVVPASFGQTEMAMDLLAQDYLLKQLSASLMYPEKDLGKNFWDRVYARAQKEFGTTHIPLSTFTKIWIVPNEAVVYERDGAAYIVKSSLRVMLEEDYVALRENLGNAQYGMSAKTGDTAQEISGVSSQVIREILIPEIEKEVNEGENFAKLRQIYHSLVLATWYKMNLKQTLLSRAYMDQNKVKGVDIEDAKVAQDAIYDQYVEAFRKGVYEYIREEEDPTTGQFIPRRYFSGGFDGEHDARGRTLQENISATRIDGNNSAVLSPDQLALVANGMRGPEGSLNVDLTTDLVENTTADGINSAVVNMSEEDLRVQEEMRRDTQAMIQPRLQDILAAVEAGDQATVDRIVNEINAVQIQGQYIPASDLVRGQGLGVVRGNALTQEKKTAANDAYLDGTIASHFLFAGGATRFMGLMYDVKIKDAAKEILGIRNGLTRDQRQRLRKNFDEMAPAKQAALIAALEAQRGFILDETRRDIPMGPRQLLAYRASLEKLAAEQGRNLEEVIAKTKIIVHFNNENFVLGIADLEANNYYGFKRENVFILNVPVVHGASLQKDGTLQLDSASQLLPPGHGFTIEQFKLNDQVYIIDETGMPSLLKGRSLLQILKSEGVETVRTQRVNDLTMWTEDVGSVERLAYFLGMVEQGNVGIGVELVTNTTEQKGGTYVTTQSQPQRLFLIETAAMMSDGYADLYQRTGRENWDYNAFRNFYTVAGLEQILNGEFSLRRYLRYKRGKDGQFHFYTETITGDVTQLNPERVVAFQLDAKEEIKDMKAPQDLPQALDYIQRYEGFISGAFEARATSVNSAVLSTVESEISGALQVLLQRFPSDQRSKVLQYLKAGKAGEKPLAALINEVNALRVNGELVNIADLVAEPGEVLSELDEKRLASRREEAAQKYLDGQIVPDFIFAGAATRLGLGSMYSVDIKQVVLEAIGRESNLTPERKASLRKNIDAAFTKDDVLDAQARDAFLDALRKEFDEAGLSDSQYGMGPRQLIAYRKFLENLARDKGHKVKAVLDQAPIVIRINDSSLLPEVLEDLDRNDFYGFNRKNVYFVSVPVVSGFDLSEWKNLHMNRGSDQLPPGHGYILRQMNQPGTVFQLDAQGARQNLEGGLLSILEARGAEVLRAQRINDVSLWTEDVGSIDRIAYFLEQMDKGVGVAIELVRNLKGQKGGSFFRDTKTGKRFLGETISMSTPSWVKYTTEIGKQQTPYNAFRNIYGIRALKQTLEGLSLPYYLRAKDGRLYVELVTGDITGLMEGNQVVPFRIRLDEDICDFKTVTDLIEAVQFVAKWEKFVGDAPGAETNAAVLSPGQMAERTQWKKGGIDFNPAFLNLTIERDGNGIPLPLPQQPLDTIKIDGFYPVIIDMTPVRNLPFILGVADFPQKEGQTDRNNGGRDISRLQPFFQKDERLDDSRGDLSFLLN